MMYRTELVEEITVENVTEKINAKNRRNGKRKVIILSRCLFLGTERAVLVFKKRAKKVVCFNIYI